MNDYLDYTIKTGGDSGGGGGGSGSPGPGCGCLLNVMAVAFVWAVITGLINLLS
ncbi:MAG: hypothetical protein J6N77_05875 [Lachnospiraceae bacterium]|nr:hypothetical protein [Lachnospiraceae bacterium]